MIDASVARAGRYGRAAVRWARLLAGGKADRRVVVFYGHDRVPAPGERAAGGTVKIQKLAARFPNTPVGFSLLYLGTTWLPRDLGPLLALVRRRGIPLVVNQDGVGYPGWAGARTDEVNRPLRKALLAADHVLYQSEFSKRSADRFLGEPSGGWEILPNAVDIERFVPAGDPPDDGPVLLLGGDQTQAYRVELALRTLRVRPPRRIPAHASLSPGGLSSTRRRSSRSSAFERTSSFSASTTSATHRPCSGARTSSSTRRCRIRARRWSSRRWRAGSRSPTRPAAAP